MSSRSERFGLAGVVALVTSLIAGVTVLSSPVSAAPVATDWVDHSFGQGIVTVDPTPGRDVSDAVVVQPDGKTVVAGTTDERTSRSDLMLLRFLSDGRPDPTFGTDGKVVLDSGGPEVAAGVVLQPDGKIVIAGVLEGEPRRMLAARLDASGRLDTSFGGGLPTFSVPYPEDIRTVADVALTPGGQILIAGTAGYRNTIGPAVLRLNSDGTPDGTFGAGGFARTRPPDYGLYEDQGVSSVLLQLDGKVLVGGTWSTADFGFRPRLTTSWFTITRFTATGTVDPTFGDAGTVLTDFSRGVMQRNAHLNGMALQPDGRIVAAGMAIGRDAEAMVARYLPDGRLDPGFGAAGFTTTYNPWTTRAHSAFGGGGQAMDVTLDSSGRVLVGGAASGFGNGDLSLMRYTPTGALDATFGRAGRIRTDVAGGNDRIVALAIQEDGRPIVVGEADRSNTGIDLAIVVARFPAFAGRSNVTAWGWNGLGQLGDGSTAQRALPVPVPGPTGVNLASAGRLHSLSLEGDGTVWAWGWNGLGQVGNGTIVDAHTPVQLPLQDVTAVAAGAYHSLAVSGGRVYAWGWNAGGQLGDGTVTDRHAPVPVAGLTDIVSVAAGIYHSLALRIDGTVWAWGWNGLGAIGDGTTIDRLRPVQVPGLVGALSISAGALHSLAVAAEKPEWATDVVWGWGYNAFHQADSHSYWNALSPMVGRVGRPSAIAAGGFHNVLLVDDGRVLTWGWNGVGQLGTGNTTDWAGPIGFVALGEGTSITAGLAHTIATDVAGRTWTMGWNGLGQLGDGTTIDRHTPVAISGNTRSSAPAAGWYHSLSVATS